EALIATTTPFGWAHAVVIVNDGSRDRTRDVALELAERFDVTLLENDPNAGLGVTLNKGLQHVGAICGDDDLVVTMDGDNTHPADTIPLMVKRIDDGHDVVVASRYCAGSLVRGVPAHRQMLSLGAALLSRTIAPLKGVRDYTCLFRMIRGSLLRRVCREVGDPLVLERGFACSMELLLLLGRFTTRMCEVPMDLKYDQKPGASSMNVKKTIVDSFSLLFRHRFGSRRA
ncbi:MAG: glycosyltransferase family 2 protein, partial [Myxococcales bacterium]|nr:glycosyltransferase family 2 protein [Myxococcales bacterium]